MKKFIAFGMSAFLVLIIYAGAVETSRTVTMNLAFNITDVNDGISRGSDYISSERNGTVLAIVSSSKTFLRQTTAILPRNIC